MQILVFINYYLPGFRSGGPVRTVANLVETLGDEIHFKILTKNHDAINTEPYKGIKTKTWHTVGKAEVMYLSSDDCSFLNLARIIKNTSFDLIYLNGFFNRDFTIKPLLLYRLGLIQKKPIIIAPRGVFSIGHLNLRRLKFYSFIYLAKLFGLYKGLLWQASTAYETSDIHRIFPGVPVQVAPNIPTAFTISQVYCRKPKTKAVLKALFISRLAPKKNLKLAISSIAKLNGKVEFDIYGPIDQPIYWDECKKLIDTSPKHIQIRYLGAIEHKQVQTCMEKYDLFVFPTLGENFGHVIIEAMLAGCPVIISDQTPWRNLEEKGVGWDIPLEQPEKYQAVLQNCVDMDEVTHKKLSTMARTYAENVINDNETIEMNRKLFQRALDRDCPKSENRF